jgi:hypothetical protein
MLMEGGEQARGNLMSRPHLLASILMVSVLAGSYLGLAPAANAELGGQRSLKSKKAAGKALTKLKRRGSSVRIHLPIGPGSVYYDYPYYYKRGYYPTRIGGYVYYPYYYYRGYRGYHRGPR